MDFSILATKLSVPITPERRVLRPRLLKRLTAGLSGRLVLISAPAGYGKTTLMADWVRNVRTPVAWLSLDERDTHPDQFLGYLIAALQSIEPELGHQAQDVFRAPAADRLQVLTLLINHMADFGEPLALVLDDYHSIQDEEIHRILTLLLEHAPSNFTLLIASRQDPPLPLATLRLRGLLTEIGPEDLRFTQGETGAFLSAAVDIQLPEDAVQILGQRTEGWVAGLQAAAFTLKGQGVDIWQGIRSFSGGHRYLLDFLAETAQQGLPDHLQQFLMDTSVLERLNGALCEAVAGIENGQSLLEELEGRGLFLQPLDSERRWYRYHPLFAEFLQNRLRVRAPDRLPMLHRRAAAWFAQNGLLDAAVEHALRAGDLEEAARLIEELASTGAVTSEPKRLLRWLEALPAGLTEINPGLMLPRAAALAASGRLDEAERSLQMAEASSVRWGPERSGQLEAVRAIIACYRGDPSAAVRLSRTALKHLAQDDLFWRGMLAINVALNVEEPYDSRVEIEQAIDILRLAARTAVTANDAYTALYAYARLGEMYRAQGRFPLARETFETALALSASKGGGRPLPKVSIAHAGLGALLYEQNDLTRAAEHARQAMSLGEQAGDPEAHAMGTLTLARIAQARGDTATALALYRTAEELAGEADIAWIRSQVGAHRTRLQLQEPDLEAAAQWAGQHSDQAAPGFGYRREVEHTALVRVALALGETEAARQDLARLEERAAAAGLNAFRIEVLALQALIHWRLGAADRAIETIQLALSEAEPEGIERVFLDEGASMQALLNEVALRGRPAFFLERVLQAFNDDAKIRRGDSFPPPGAPDGLFEPLTNREQQILGLLASGASNREIAAELILSVGTVKTHLHNIYGKLGVRSRTQAIARGRELELV